MREPSILGISLKKTRAASPHEIASRSPTRGVWFRVVVRFVGVVMFSGRPFRPHAHSTTHLQQPVALLYFASAAPSNSRLVFVIRVDLAWSTSPSTSPCRGRLRVVLKSSSRRPWHGGVDERSTFNRSSVEFVPKVDASLTQGRRKVDHRSTLIDLLSSSHLKVYLRSTYVDARSTSYRPKSILG